MPISETRCDYPDNIDYKKEIRAWGIKKGSSQHACWSTINKDNNCEFYKRKWWKFWVKEDL